MPVTRAQFDRQYRALVEDREFVEYRDYYRRSIGRFWKAFDKIQHLNLPLHCRAIDIGGGIMAVLLSRILGIDACVGDVNDRPAGDISDLGIKFQLIDLTTDNVLPRERFDLVILQEVIEHLPQPPYITFQRIMKFLTPDGVLFFTTPNGSRVRNILYMLTGRAVLDNFRYPGPGEVLGHQQEYLLPQLKWQLERAGMAPIIAEQYDDGWQGATIAARTGHLLARSANLFPHLRNGLMVAAQPAAARANRLSPSW